MKTFVPTNRVKPRGLGERDVQESTYTSITESKTWEYGVGM